MVYFSLQLEKFLPFVAGGAQRNTDLHTMVARKYNQRGNTRRRCHKKSLQRYTTNSFVFPAGPHLLTFLQPPQISPSLFHEVFFFFMFKIELVSSSKILCSLFFSTSDPALPFTTAQILIFSFKQSQNHFLIIVNLVLVISRLSFTYLFLNKISYLLTLSLEQSCTLLEVRYTFYFFSDSLKIFNGHSSHFSACYL